MDARDLLRLRETIERAIEKQDTTTRVLESSGLQNFDVSGE